jgi:nitric oxide reductase large subunit
MGWQTFFYMLGILLAGWLVYSQVRNNPLAFTKESFGKSAFTLGILALLLIGFITLLVLMLRHG